jgi:hypothetical protein
MGAWSRLASGSWVRLWTLELNTVEGSRYSGGSQYDSGVDLKKISSEKLASRFRPSGKSRGRTGWGGRVNTGEAESAAQVRRLDLTSERYSEKICGFSRGALISWFLWESNCVLSFGPGGFVLHPASYVRQEGERVGSSWLEASCSLEFNPPLISRS